VTQDQTPRRHRFEWTRAKLRTLAQRAGAKMRAVFERKVVRPVALTALVRHTTNFDDVKFLGRPMWQNIADIWALQEAINDFDIDVILECGTNRGGSAFFMASMMDLRQKGHVITVDVKKLMEFEHPRIEFVEGSSTDPAIVSHVRKRVADLAPNNLLIVLDSDHAEHHVLGELQAYADLVKVGGYVVVQDTVIDELRIFRDSRPGPLPAVKRFLRQDPRFEIDEQRSARFLFNHSPSGWLRRVR
jgi:cephalosporin hydroxylase